MSDPTYEPKSIAGAAMVEDKLYELRKQIEYPPGWLEDSGVLNLTPRYGFECSVRERLLQLGGCVGPIIALRKTFHGRTEPFLRRLGSHVDQLGDAWIQLTDLARRRLSNPRRAGHCCDSADTVVLRSSADRVEEEIDLYIESFTEAELSKVEASLKEMGEEAEKRYRSDNDRY